MSLSNALQTAVAAALLADATVTGLVADSAAGRAVFAPHQPFPDVWPRVTLEVPQVLGAQIQCGPGRRECFVTAHSWASGPAATLEAGALADAVAAVLDAPLSVAGHRVSTHRFVSSRPVGDPNPDVEHVVSVFRYLIQPTG